MKLLIAAAVACILAWALCFPLHRVLVHWGIVDRPNARSSHQSPTARGGGVAILVSVWLVALSGLLGPLSRSLVATLAAATFLAVISFIDDIRTLSARIRFACHLVAAAIVTLALSGEHEFTSVGAASLVVASTIIWLVGHTNAFNFMDGINGLAAIQGAITGVGMAVLVVRDGGSPEAATLLSAAVAGAALGFIPHNFPRARLFLGDVGSAPIGFMLATVVVWLAHENPLDRLVPLLLLHSNFILDTSITLARRVWRGERWFEAHREHFYQRLIRSGCSHLRVTTTVAVIQSIALALILQYTESTTSPRFAIIIGVVTLWLGFFAWSERRFIASQDGN